MHRVRISGLAMTIYVIGFLALFGGALKLTAALFLLATLNDTRIARNQ